MTGVTMIGKEFHWIRMDGMILKAKILTEPVNGYFIADFDGVSRLTSLDKWDIL